MEMYREKFNTALNKKLPEELEGWQFRVEESGDYGSPRCVHYVGFAFGVNMSFCMQQYPACCAFEQLNNFRYSDGVSEKQVHAFIDHVIKVMRTQFRSEFAKKLMLNTVQWNSEDYSVYSTDLDPKKMKGKFYYPHVHSWAMKQKAVLDTPIVNHNTSNIIHHLICFVAE